MIHRTTLRLRALLRKQDLHAQARDELLWGPRRKLHRISGSRDFAACFLWIPSLPYSGDDLAQRIDRLAAEPGIDIESRPGSNLIAIYYRPPTAEGGSR